MVERRTVMRKAKAREQEPEGTRVMDEEDPIGRESTLSQVAFRLGCHRVTLLRMEQRKAIPPARWRRKPAPHRVYNETEIEAIKIVLDAARKEQDEGRNYIEAAQ